MSNMRGEFLRWSGEHGGYGCEEAAFEAGWEAALNTVVTPNTSTDKPSDEIKPECLTQCQYQRDHKCHSWSRCNDRTTA